MRKKRLTLLVILGFLVVVIAVFFGWQALFSYKKYTSENCGYQFEYPATWRVNDTQDAEAACAQRVAIKSEGADTPFDYYPQSQFQVDYFPQGYTIRWYDDCYEEFVKIREQSVPEAFAWKEANCPDIHVATLDEIVDTLGEPTERTRSGEIEMLLYQVGPSQDKDSGFYGYERYTYFLQKGDVIVRIESPLMWPKIIKGGERIYQSFEF